MFVGLSSEILQEPTEIANGFNEFFHSIFTSSNYVLPDMDALLSPSSQLSSITINSGDVFTALVCLKYDKAMGCDNMSAKVLKACAMFSFEPVRMLKLSDGCCKHFNMNNMSCISSHIQISNNCKEINLHL